MTVYMRATPPSMRPSPSLADVRARNEMAVDVAAVDDDDFASPAWACGMAHRVAIQSKGLSQDVAGSRSASFGGRTLYCCVRCAVSLERNCTCGLCCVAPDSPLRA